MIFDCLIAINPSSQLQKRKKVPGRIPGACVESAISINQFFTFDYTIMDKLIIEPDESIPASLRVCA